MKRVSVPALSLIFLAVVSFLYADGNSLPRTIRAGFFQFDGYHEMANDGAKSGYGYDLLQKLARYTGWKYAYVGYNSGWSEMQQMLKEGRIDILTSAQKTPERENQFAFSHKSIGTSEAILTVKSGNDRFVPGEYSTYSGMRVGLLKGSSRNIQFDNFAHEHHFTYVPVYFNDLDEMISALHTADSVDTLLTSNLRRVKNEWVLEQFDPSPFYVMVRKNDRVLLADIDRAIDEMDMFEPDWRNQLWNAYYRTDTGEEIPFSTDERAYLRMMKYEKKVLTAIIEPDRNPYSYFRNGKPEGIIAEIFKEIERRTGLSFTVIETKNRKEYFDRIKQGGIDVRIDTYSDYYEAEQNGFRLTDPYITTTVSRITKKTFSGIPMSVAVLKYADHTKVYDEIINSSPEIQLCDTTADCIQSVYSGRTDAAYIYTYMAQKIINEDLRSRLTSSINPQYQVSFSLGISDSDDVRLLTILNKAVNSVNSGFSEKVIMRQSESLRVDPSITGFLLSHPLVGAIVLIAFAVFLAILAVMIMRQHNLKALEHKNVELAAAIEESERANRAKSSFLSNMSHEIRTPMNAIVGIIAIAKGHENEPEKVKEYLSKIDTSSRVLLGIINEVLDMSAIESSKITLAAEVFSFTAVVDSITAIYEGQCRTKGVSFVVHNTMISDAVIGDKLRVNQILMNLVSNAFKFTDCGGTIVMAFGETIRSENSVTVNLTVSDSGCGMSAEMMSRLFKPFEQENPDTVQKYGGSGLGLSITKNLIDLMHGTITVQSKKGKGTVFSVSIPFIKADLSESAGILHKEAEHVYDFTGCRFLLAEDNELNREIAVELLSSVHAVTDTAENGKIAADMFASSMPGTYCAVLMDMRMPVLDGVRAARLIRSLPHPQAETIPIIAMTANAYKEDVDACIDAGMNAHLSKPIEPEKLYSELEKYISSQYTQVHDKSS